MNIALVFTEGLEPEALEGTLASVDTIAQQSKNTFLVFSTYDFVAENYPHVEITKLTQSQLNELAFLENLAPDDFVEILNVAVTFKKNAFARYESGAAGLPDVQMHVDRTYQHRLVEHTLERGSMTVNDDEAIWTGAFPLLVRTSVLRVYRELDILDHSILYNLCLVHSGRMRIIPDAVAMPAENPDLRYLDNFDSDWYLEFVRRWEKLFDLCNSTYQGVPETLQKAFLYLLEMRIVTNVNTKHKQVLNSGEVDQFFLFLGRVLSSVSDELLLRGSDVLQNLNRSTRMYLQSLKPDKEAAANYQRTGNDVLTRYGYTTIASLSGTRIAIDSMAFYEDKLEIAGFFPAFVDHENVDLFLESSTGNQILLPDVERYSEFQIFGKNIHRHPTFVASVELKDFIDAKWLRFVSIDKVSGIQIVHDLKFRKPLAKLTSRNRSYWDLGPVLMRYEDKSLRIEPSSKKNVFLAESRFLVSILKNREKGAGRAALLRMAFWLTKPFFGSKRVWLYSDKVYKAGDNGEYAFNYASKQDDGIKKYYVQRSDTPDASRFRQEKKKFLKFGTLKHKLAFLNADIVFATHTVLPLQHGLGKIERHLRGLFLYNTVFLQHGLSVQRLPWILNKYVDNTRMYCLASDFEKRNLMLPEAGYSEEDLVTTGVARYDGLISNAQKRILITPTWRTYLSPPGRFGQSKPRSEQFLQSDYFLLYTRLLNDERLVAAARNSGYTLQFLLHPVISSHYLDFQEVLNDVEVLAATDDVSYEKLLTEADVMVTDYSGVQFDFAYMNKPILYYHPETLPPSYEEGVYSYETDALGKVFAEQDELVAELIRLMEKGCQLDPEIGKKIKNFFYHQDHQNGKRIYDAVIAKDFKRQ
ncbi:MAG: CDP-glycerol glycerophosphotransferase family protein [Microbacteriaceae bacterium]